MSRTISIDPLTVDPEKKIERRFLAQPLVVEFSCPVESDSDDATLLRALADWIEEQEPVVTLIHASFRWCDETDRWQLWATVDT